MFSALLHILIKKNSRVKLLNCKVIQWRLIIGYEMNLENNNNTFPVMAPERARVRTHVHKHTHTIQSSLYCTHLHTQTNTAMSPVHIKPTKQFAQYYHNSTNKIPSVRPTAATGTEYSYWGEGWFRTARQKEKYETTKQDGGRNQSFFPCEVQAERKFSLA